MGGERAARRSAALFAGAAAVLVAGVARADVFVYKDASGVEHFTTSAGDAKHYRRVGHPGGRGGAAWYTRFDGLIVEAARLYEVPEALVRAIIRCESDFDPTAVSPVGAQGLMQLMPETAKRLGVQDVWDPRENIFGGARLLRELAREFHGDLALTVAAYNAGDVAVVRYGGVPPYPETREYVSAVTRFFRRYQAIRDPVRASEGGGRKGG
jgi:soluble lytic murein transglycosylase-like protein